MDLTDVDLFDVQITNSYIDENKWRSVEIIPIVPKQVISNAQIMQISPS